MYSASRPQKGFFYKYLPFFSTTSAFRKTNIAKKNEPKETWQKVFFKGKKNGNDKLKNIYIKTRIFIIVLPSSWRKGIEILTDRQTVKLLIHKQTPFLIIVATCSQKSRCNNDILLVIITVVENEEIDSI